MKKRFYVLVPIIAVFLIITGFTKTTVSDERFSNLVNDDGETSVAIKDANVIDYLIEDNYVYFLVYDELEDNCLECLKYDINTQETTMLYTINKPIFYNVYSHFLKKTKDSNLIINLRDIIIVIDTDNDTVENEIQFSEDKLYGDINYSCDKLCYYRNGGLYLSDIDFSNEKILTQSVVDTEDGIQPCFSHDDEKIAYFNYYQVEIIDTKGNLEESLPRAARYVKWSQDDKSIIIGANAGGTKIDLENRKIFATHYLENDYTGFDINYFDNLSCEVIYSGLGDLIAYKLRTTYSSWDCNTIGFFDGTNKYTFAEQEMYPELIRWVSQTDDIAVLYDDSGYKRLRFININDVDFILQDYACYYIEDGVCDDEEYNDPYMECILDIFNKIKMIFDN